MDNVTGSDVFMVNATTATSTVKDVSLQSWDDATWILTSSFIIFTMQSGFGLLEAGCVSSKNEVNIMVKNAVDVVFGGLTYWMFGYGFSFGADPGSNPFIGWGSFCVDSSDPIIMGTLFPNFVFQLSFATTATTIVSGAMAERTRLTSYIVFSLLNTIVYCIPAHWVWADNGFLKQLGVLDFAGSGVVHMLGAVSALVAAVMLGPRMGRYDEGLEAPPAGNAANCLVGMFMLWWGWLAFNCGSTYGISGGKWILAAKSAVTTLNASMAGGLMGVIFTFFYNNHKFIITDIVNSILGALVSITASCAMVKPWESLVIGAVGGIISILLAMGVDKLKIDDPVGAVAVHGGGGLWGMLAVGLFVGHDPLEGINGGKVGLFHGGGFYLLGVQTLAVLIIFVWSGLVSFILLFFVDRCFGLRMSEEEEILGADAVEHGLAMDDMDDDHLSHVISVRPATATSKTSMPTARKKRSAFSSRKVPSRLRRSSSVMPEQLPNGATMPRTPDTLTKRGRHLTVDGISTIST